MSVRAAPALALGLAACEPDRPGPGDPVEGRPPNAAWQEPAFPGQTRAPGVRTRTKLRTDVVATGLEHPWALAFLPDGRMLVTERPGRLLLLDRDGRREGAVAGVPEVDARDQGGLLDVVLSPDFASDRRVFLSFSEPRDGGNGTAVARATLDLAARRLDDLAVVFRAVPTLESTKHFGCRLVFDRDGMLFVTLGERSILEGRAHAQDPESTLGKIVRIAPDGGIPADNPFVDAPPTLPEIWSLGHRNPQGAALHPETGRLWTTEHGPNGGDEVNVPRAGLDYGWPVITYGQEYDGRPVGEGITAREGYEQPVYYWDPSIAPSGMAFYDADAIPEWRGDLFVGALAGEHLDRLVLDGERVVGEERFDVGPVADRIRDVRVGPDGALWVLTDQPRGALVRLGR